MKLYSLLNYRDLKRGIRREDCVLFCHALKYPILPEKNDHKANHKTGGQSAREEAVRCIQTVSRLQRIL